MSVIASGILAMRNLIASGMQTWTRLGVALHRTLLLAAILVFCAPAMRAGAQGPRQPAPARNKRLVVLPSPEVQALLDRAAGTTVAQALLLLESAQELAEARHDLPGLIAVASEAERRAHAVIVPGLDGTDALLRQALAIRRNHLPRSVELAHVLGDLGYAAWLKNDQRRARGLLDESIEILEHHDISRDRADLGVDVRIRALCVAREIARADKRDETLRRRESRLKSLARTSPDRIVMMAETEASTAQMLASRGDKASADRLSSLANAMVSLLDAGSISAVDGWARLGKALKYDREKAGIYLQLAFAAAVKAEEEAERARDLVKLRHLVRCYRTIAEAGWGGDPATTVPPLRRAVDLTGKVDPRSDDYWGLSAWLTICLSESGRITEAEEVSRRASAAAEQWRPGARAQASRWSSVSTVLAYRGDFLGADQACQRVIANLKAAGDRYWLAPAMAGRAYVLMCAGNLEEARKQASEALVAAANLSRDDAQVGWIHQFLFSVAMADGDLASAEKHAREALRVFRAALPKTHHEALSLAGLGSVLLMRRPRGRYGSLSASPRAI